MKVLELLLAAAAVLYIAVALIQGAAVSSVLIQTGLLILVLVLLILPLFLKGEGGRLKEYEGNILWICIALFVIMGILGGVL